MTFSIVARDPQTGELGIAVQSKFLAVGAVVPWAKAGVGAIATQAWANTSYGPRGEIAGASSQQRCLLCAKEAVTADLTIALSTCAWMTISSPSRNCSASCNCTSSFCSGRILRIS